MEDALKIPYEDSIQWGTKEEPYCENAIKVTREIKSQSSNPVKDFCSIIVTTNSKHFLKHSDISLTATTCEGINVETTYKGFEVFWNKDKFLMKKCYHYC